MIRQVFRFGIVGLLAAMLHFSVVVLMVQRGSIEPLLANVFAFVLSFQVSYWGHRHWTFENTVVSHGIAFPKLAFVQIINFAANETLFYIFLTLHLPYDIALLIVLTVLPLFTFAASKLWIFR